ncbi:MAG: DUF1329 domain-containing protein [Comamonas sp.]
MQARNKGTAAALCMGLLAAGAAMAKVPAAEADRLGKDLTCTGATKAGNADGSIPAFTGKILGVPPGVQFTKSVGQFQPDIYAGEKPLFEITAANMAQYADKLSEGQKALLAKFPGSMRLPVYPGHRDFRYDDAVCAVAKRNATEAEVVSDGFGVKGFMGALPFPFPKTGAELLWNTMMPSRAYTEEVLRDLAIVSPNGSTAWGRTNYVQLSNYDSPANLGKPGTATGDYYAWVTNYTQLPEREKGSVVLSIEPMNFGTHKRLAWNYDSGTRRVRQLPEFGFDQPLPGSSGKVPIDAERLFNGSPERYEWSLQGKREMFIPANTFRLHQPIKYADLLKTGHLNPDYRRYELRRVWVLEGKLKSGYRHVYSKRVLYIDEDTGHAVSSDFYDARGQLWQYGEINYYYAFDTKKWHSGTGVYHDLSNGSYVAMNLFQERGKALILDKGDLKPSQFTPEAIRNLGN